MTKTFVLLSALVLCAAMLIPASVSAYNGDGLIESYKPLAVTVGSSNDLEFVFYNDASSGVCIDEIVITAPATWGGLASVTEYTRGGTGVITVTNEADAANHIATIADSQSVRIVPNSPLCAGERVEITVAGLVAPTFAEDSVFKVLTSDQNNQNPTPTSWVRREIDVQPVIRVTRATGLKLEYLHLKNFVGSGGSAGFTGRGTGAAGRLDSLFLLGTVAGTVNISIENGANAGYQQGQDILLGICTITGSGVVNTCSLTYPSPWPGPANIKDGYVPDGQEWGYYFRGYGGTLLQYGHTDSPADPVPPNSMTGLSGAVGTIIDVDHPTVGRTVNIQLIDANGWDVNDDQIPIFFETDLGHFVDTPSPQYTDSDGNKYLTLLPDCEKGVADLDLSSLQLSGSNNNISEYVGINAGVPVSFEVTEGQDAEIVGGENQLIEVTLYDGCGNVITDAPQKPVVKFDLTSTCDGKLAEDPSNPPASNFHEEEQTNMGVADTYLVTTCELCQHEVVVSIDGMGSETVYLNGIVGDPYKVVVTAGTTPDGKMAADDCIGVLVEVTDACGNRIVDYLDPISGHMQQWESIVRVEIVDPLVSPEGSTYIDGTDFREERFLDDHTVQGKLNLGAGYLEVCGCQGLGQFLIVANTDTLEPGSEEVDVENADPDCINVSVGQDSMLVCEKETSVDVSVLDVCGNKLIDQECNGGNAHFCVDIMVEGTGNNPCTADDAHLSTDSVCADLKLTGTAPTATLYRDSDNCCELEVVAIDAEDCCPLYPMPLPQCDPAPEVRFVGFPDYMTTTFKSVNPANQYLVDQGRQITSEEVKDEFAVFDTCSFLVYDFAGTVDAELKGEDCASFIEVKSPYALKEGQCTGSIPCSVLGQFGQATCEAADCIWKGSECTGDPAAGNCAGFDMTQCTEPFIDVFCDWEMDEFCDFAEPVVLDKVVIDNCADPGKQWTDLEEEDIMVDKLAFDTAVLPDPPNLAIYIYKETEAQAGFQISGPTADRLVGRAPWKPSEVIIELQDAQVWEGLGADWWSRGWGFDDQREGGVLVRAGDTADFYVVLQSHPNASTQMRISCGTYEAVFEYYQDYNSPDITKLVYGGDVEDHCIDSDNYNWINPEPHPVPSATCGGAKNWDSRNDDYMVNGTPHYPGETADYGFGDRYADDILFQGGYAYLYFRDLTAEHVQVILSDLRAMGRCEGYKGLEKKMDIVPNPEEIGFESQLATQVVLINHDGFMPKTVICTNDEFEPAENAFLLNLQTADGFQNPHAKQVEVEMDYCLKLPFGDWVITHAVEEYCNSPKVVQTVPQEDIPEICKTTYMDEDHCFTREEFKELLKETELGQYAEELLFGDFLGTELSDWIDSYFENAKVKFYDITKHALPLAADGKPVVTTDVNGQAQVYVTSKYPGLFKIIATPLALDADYTFVSFAAGEPAKLDIVAVPAFGVPADGEEEAMLLLRVLDDCGNVVYDHIDDVTVTAAGQQVVISEDFDGNNNYDNSVTGDLYPSLLGEMDLKVLSDLPQTATITASAYGLVPDSTTVAFQGAPVKLVITSISPSDRLPADAQTGAWVTVEVQDRNGNRVTGYLGNGFSGDPGDPWGYTDYTFENICVQVGPMGMVGAMGIFDPLEMTKFGWTNFHMVQPGGKTASAIYCGDLMFGRGSVYVVYDGEECNHGGTLDVDVFDAVPYQGQEINENGIPSSLKPTQLEPAHGGLEFVDPATQWNIWASKKVVPADGKSKVVLSIQVENQYMDIRQAVEGNVYVGGTAENGAVVKWNGVVDPHNPTSARIVTDPITGRTTLEMTSTTPGVAEVTITGGKAYVCMPAEPLGFECQDGNCGIGGISMIYGTSMCHYTNKIDLKPMTITVEFLEVADNEVYLQTGWNFISVPYLLDVSKDQVSEIFNLSKVDSIYAWNSSAQAFYGLGAGSVLSPLQGYWVKMSEADVISLVYAAPSMPSIPTKAVKKGWNTVGLTWNSPMLVKNALISIDKSYAQVIGWDAVTQKYELPVANTGGLSPFESGGYFMTPKMGYWMWVTAEDTVAGLTA